MFSDIRSLNIEISDIKKERKQNNGRQEIPYGRLGLGEGRSIISAVLQSEYWELGNICDLNEELC